MAPAEADRMTMTERNLVLHDGISTIIFDEPGKAMVEQVVTTYQTNTFGMDDRSLLKLNTADGRLHAPSSVSRSPATTRHTSWPETTCSIASRRDRRSPRRS